MNFLVIRLSSMGDIIQSTAILPLIKANYPNSHITFLTSIEFTDLMAAHPLVDNVLLYNRKETPSWKDLNQLIKNAHKSKSFDVIFDLHNSTRTKLSLLWMPKIPRLVVPKRRFTKLLLTKLKTRSLFSKQSHPDRLVELFGDLFYNRSNQEIFEILRKQTYCKSKCPDRKTSLPHDKNSTQETLEKFNIRFPYLVIAPSASYQEKRWPLEKFNELILNLLKREDLNQYRIIVLAGPSDDFCQQIIQDNRVINLQGQTTLKQTMEIISQCEFVLGNDSGLTHMAEAYGVLVSVIFGPTVPEFGFAPHLKQSTIIEKELWCRPCSHLGHKKCFRKDQYCMKNINIKVVSESIRVAGM